MITMLVIFSSISLSSGGLPLFLLIEGVVIPFRRDYILSRGREGGREITEIVSVLGVISKRRRGGNGRTG